MRHLACLLASSLLGACARAPSPRPEPAPRPVVAPASPPPTAPAPRAPAPSQPPPASGVVPAGDAATAALWSGFSGFGKACEPSGPIKTACSKTGEIVGAFGAADHVNEAPEGAEIVAQAAKTKDGREAPPSYVATAGDWLFVRVVTCAYCRRILGWSFAGKPSDMQDGDLLQLASRLGVPESEPPLRSTAAWREAPIMDLTPPR